MSECQPAMGVSEQTFYRSKKAYGGMLPGEARKIRQPREENSKLGGDEGPKPKPAAAITPTGLDVSALEHGVGSPFFPGIEVSWQVPPDVFVAPFRIEFGGLSKCKGEIILIEEAHLSRQN